MKVLAVCHWNYVGFGPVSGADVMIHDLMKYLVSQGWDADSIHVGLPAFKTIDGVRAFRTQGLVEASAAQADLIVTHLGATQIAKAIGKRYAIPVVQLIHNTTSPSIGFLASGADYVLWNSNWIKKFHEDVAQGVPVVREWLHEGKTVVRRRKSRIWNGQVLHPPANRVGTLGGNPDGAITLVNLVPNKGPEILYGLASAFPARRFRGVLGGYDQDKQDIRSADNVHIHPYTDDMDLIYRDTSVLISPSVYESYGMAALEAMSYGIPVITSGTQGLVECVSEGGLHAQRTADSFGLALELTTKDYDHYSARASARYKYLYEQTQEELRSFGDKMKGLVANGPN